MTKAKEVRAAKSPQPEEEEAPLLSIRSLTKPTAHVDIDFGSGKMEPYHFVNLDAIGIMQRQRIADLLTETFKMGGDSVGKKFTKKDEELYDKKLRELALLIIPSLTKKKLGTGKGDSGLGTGHLSDIAVAFFVASGEAVPNKLELTARMKKLANSIGNQTGASSSQGSPGSTNRRARRRRG